MYYIAVTTIREQVAKPWKKGNTAYVLPFFVNSLSIIKSR